MNSQHFLALSLLFLLGFLQFPAYAFYTPQGLKEKPTSIVSSSRPHAFDPSQVAQISWSPRAFLYKGFLSSQECDHLIDLAKDKLEKSMVVDDETGKSVEGEERTSSQMSLAKAQDNIVANVEARIAAWTFLPEENGETIQILRYEKGQKYEPHFDYLSDEFNKHLGGHRLATVLMYLSDVEKGGETVFPNLEASAPQLSDDSWSSCAQRGYAVKPKKGDALLFFSLHPNGTTDPNSLHGSCPVIVGEKWSATKWIHVKSFDKEFNINNCIDKNERCQAWALAGECEKNPTYMIGSTEFEGFCRKSCKACFK